MVNLMKSSVLILLQPSPPTQIVTTGMVKSSVLSWETATRTMDTIDTMDTMDTMDLSWIYHGFIWMCFWCVFGLRCLSLETSGDCVVSSMSMPSMSALFEICWFQSVSRSMKSCAFYMLCLNVECVWCNHPITWESSNMFQWFQMQLAILASTATWCYREVLLAWHGVTWGICDQRAAWCACDPQAGAALLSQGLGYLGWGNFALLGRAGNI